MKTLFFSGCETLDDVKKRYKVLALANHPDRGGDTETMQAINLEYEKIIKSGCFEFKTEEEKQENLIYPEVISNLVTLEGIVIEVIFRWIWVSGNTKQHRQALKNFGLKYAPKKQMWYYRPEGWAKVFNRSKPMDMEEIRARYGSEFVNKNDYKNRNKKEEEKTLKSAS
jgi:hypothetical protein